jgi:hypothetical protein
MPRAARWRRPKKALVVVVGMVLLLIVAWVVVGRIAASLNDRFESFYPTLEEASKDGAITRGWIPDEFLPPSSRSIHEIHDLSPSTEWCAFEFVPTDSQYLLKNLKPIDLPPPSLRQVPSPGVLWWPSVFEGNLDSKKIHNAGLDLYVVERPATSVTTTAWLFAVDRSKGQGFFYSYSR